MAELEALQAGDVIDEPDVPVPAIRKNEPKPVDLRTVMPELSNTGVIEQLLKLPRVQAMLEPPENRKAA